MFPENGRLSAVPKLEILCIGVLALHIDLYIEQLGSESLALLPVEAKAMIITILRRRGTLSNSILSALLDASFTVLDLNGCHQLSDKAIRNSVCNLPLLQALDLTGCVSLSGHTLKQIAASCPLLKLLRLGGKTVEQAAGLVLPDILPKIVPMSDQDLEDNWEGLIDSGSQGKNNVAPIVGHSLNHKTATLKAFGMGRLTELRWLIWPNVPFEARNLVSTQCPKVKLNPSFGGQHTGIAPLLANRKWDPLDPCCDLDEPLASLASPKLWSRLGSTMTSKCSTPAVVPQTIAEKFRQAYIDQGQRLREKEKRSYALLSQKKLRSSRVLQALDTWLDDGSILGI